MTLIPPSLPPFLGGMFELRTVEGLPTDEDVKTVQAVIRALENFSNMPNFYDSNLAMMLSQHLFGLQMARYRNRYPQNMFPTNTIYTPPVLPTHIPITLEPVIGNPSNEQVKSVQTALRFSENFAWTPTMFDANLSMNLSQHLFDIQFERHLHSIFNQNTTNNTSLPTNELNHHNTQEIDGSSREAHEHMSDHESSTDTERTNHPTILTDSQPVRANSENTITRDEGSKILGDIRSLLESIKQFMIVSQNVMARGLNSTYYYKSSWGRQIVHSLFNEKGEYPESVGLPSIGSFCNHLFTDGTHMSDNILAQYLRFYSIGEDFIDLEGDSLGIKADKKSEATATLRRFLRAE